jgi:hypothetical protein
MRLTTCEPFRTVSTALQAMQQHVWQPRHQMTFVPRLAIPMTILALLPRLACADHGWGYRRAGMDLRSDRDVDSGFLRGNT